MKSSNKQLSIQVQVWLFEGLCHMTHEKWSIWWNACNSNDTKLLAFLPINLMDNWSPCNTTHGNQTQMQQCQWAYLANITPINSTNTPYLKQLHLNRYWKENSIWHLQLALIIKPDEQPLDYSAIALYRNCVYGMLYKLTVLFGLWLEYNVPLCHREILLAPIR